MIPVSGFLTPPPPPPPNVMTLFTLPIARITIIWRPPCCFEVSWQKYWNTSSCRNKKPTPSNLIGSMMILRSYPSMFHHAMRRDTLSLLHWNHIWPMMIYHSTSIIRRQCKDKGHSSHPQEKPQSTSTAGEGGSTLHWAGGGGLPNWIMWNTFSCRNKSLVHLTW